jgi:hypothetical protein
MVSISYILLLAFQELAFGNLFRLVKAQAVQSWQPFKLVYLLLPPPPRNPPPPRDPMLEAPRELLARALAPEPPEKALLLLEPALPLETWRFPILSPPPPPAERFMPCAFAPALEFPLLNELAPWPIFCRAAVCRCVMLLPRAAPPYWLATARFP